MCDYVVVIPSYDRSDIISSKTLNTLKLGGVPKNRIYIFVANEEEEIKYKSKVSKDLYNEMVVGVIGLVPQRQFINDYFEENTYIIAINDDIDDIILKVSPDKSDKEIKKVNLPQLFKKAYDEMIKNKIFLWGVAPTSNPFFLYKKTTYDLKFINGAFYGYLNRDDDDIKLKYGAEKEDSERCLRYYKKDGKLLRYNDIAFKTSLYSKGGMMTICGNKKNRLIDSKLCAEQLKNEFGEYGEIYTRKDGRTEFKFNMKIKPILSDEIQILEHRDDDKIKKIQEQILKYLKDHPNCIQKIRKAEVANGGKPTRGDKIGEIGRTRTFGFGNKRNLGWAEFEANKQMPELFRLLVELGNSVVPIGYFYNAITFNVGVQAKKHTDGLNNGFSVLTGFGNYNGGKLRIYNKEDTEYEAYDVKNKSVMFDGNLLSHETEPFTGERITVIYYKQKYMTKLKDFETVGI